MVEKTGSSPVYCPLFPCPRVSHSPVRTSALPVLRDSWERFRGCWLEAAETLQFSWLVWLGTTHAVPRTLSFPEQFSAQSFSMNKELVLAPLEGTECPSGPPEGRGRRAGRAAEPAALPAPGTSASHSGGSWGAAISRRRQLSLQGRRLHSCNTSLP